MPRSLFYCAPVAHLKRVNYRQAYIKGKVASYTGAPQVASGQRTDVT